MTLLLASASPRRRDLLASSGIALVVHPVACDETWQLWEEPVAYTRRLAGEKASLARAGNPDHRGPILAADTTVWRDGGPPLGKPRDRAHARAMLTDLTCGQPHNVTTAFYLLPGPAAPAIVEHTTTRVWMRRLTAGEREAYLDTNEWQGKAGGYAIQGYAGGFVTRIEGSYSGVVGLPVAQVVEALARARAG